MAGAFQSDFVQTDAFQVDTGSTTTDSVTTSESISRALVLFRTAVDSVTTSESARASSPRTTSDTVTLSETITQTHGATVTATDAVTISENVTRALALLRTATDAPTTSQSVSRLAVLNRTTTGIVTTSESVTRTKTSARTTTDAATLSESAVATKTGTAVDHVTLSDSVARTGTFHPATTDLASVRDFALRTVIPLGGVGADGSGGASSGGLQWDLEGHSEIGPLVVYEGTVLRSAAQGVAEEGVVLVRDIGQDPGSFIPGKRLSVRFDNMVIWSGYLVRATRSYWFDVDNPDTTNRLWKLAVVDINVLFARRVVYNKANPARLEGPLYTTSTTDRAAILALVNDWLDLSTDNLDTSTLVNAVAPITDGTIETYPWNGGEFWGDAMHTITQLPATIWCLTPDRQLVNADVDSEDAPFVLSDRPTAGQVGYREFTWFSDAAELANDYFAWGAGKGENQMVFRRITDSGSVATHGVWQESTLKFDVFKQTTINRIADSYVNGSPSSKRGHKNDQTKVELTVVENGLRVGQRVRVINNGYGLDAVIPIREVEITFPEPEQPYYKLILRHEYDDPWGYYDIPPWLTPGSAGGGGGGGGGCFDCPIITTQPGGCDCGITDSFNRTVVGGWGTSDAGIAWVTVPGVGGATFGVDGSQATITAPAQDGLMEFGISPANTQPVPFEMFLDADVTGTSGTLFQAQLTIGCHGDHANLDLKLFLSAGIVEIENGAADGLETATGQTLTGPLKIHVLKQVGPASNQTQVFANVWPASDPEPAGWLVTDSKYVGQDTYEILDIANGYSTVAYDNLIVTGLDICTENGRFDNFNRAASTAGWGVSDFGLPWDYFVAPPAAGTVGLSGSTAYGSFPIGFGGGGQIDSIDGPWAATDGFMMTGHFRTDTVPNSGGQQFSLNIGDLANVRQILFIISNAGSTGEVWCGPDQVITKNDWLANTDYLWKWEYRPGTLQRLKLWLASDPEPDWLLTSDQTDPPSTFFYMDIENNSGTDPAQIDIDWIDFDYAGKPCACGPQNRYDNFNRTVASGWGTSDFGLPWSGGGSRTSVNGASALIVSPVGLAIDDIYALSGPWITMTGFTMTAVFSISGTIPVSFREQALIFEVIDGSSPFDNAHVTIDVNNGSVGGIIIRDDVSSDADSASKTDWISNQQYNVMWEHIPGTVSRAKVWATNASDPGWMVSIATSNTPTSDATFHVVAQNTSLASHTVSIDWIDFEYAGKPCHDNPPSEVQSGGQVCQHTTITSALLAEMTGGLILQSSYFPGSVQVWINGLLWLPGTDFQETTPSLGLVTFSRTPSVGDSFTICYLPLIATEP